jgi:predicted esterase
MGLSLEHGARPNPTVLRLAAPANTMTIASSADDGIAAAAGVTITFDRGARALMNRFLALLPALFGVSATLAAPGFEAGGLNEFKVELPRELRQVAGRGHLSPVTDALVTIAVPANFDMARDWPVMVISATTDPGYRSSRRLLGAYAGIMLPDGWILVAADPAEEIAAEQDDIPLRLALNSAALAALESRWSGARKAPLAFGGFSGGAKASGWLAAAFADQGRTIIGIYLAGVNEDTVVSAAKHFAVLNETYRRVPIFLQSGEKDQIATPADHRRVYEELKRARFRHIRVEYFPGAHVVDPASLRTALDWFRALAAQPNAAR